MYLISNFRSEVQVGSAAKVKPDQAKARLKIRGAIREIVDEAFRVMQAPRLSTLSFYNEFLAQDLDRWGKFVQKEILV